MNNTSKIVFSVGAVAVVAIALIVVLMFSRSAATSPDNKVVPPAAVPIANEVAPPASAPQVIEVVPPTAVPADNQVIPPTAVPAASAPKIIKVIPPKEVPIVKVLTPNGGEDYCLNDEKPISWQVPQEAGDVDISLDIRSGTQYISDHIGTFPSTYNETGEKNTGKGTYIWKVGSYAGGTAPVGFAEAVHYTVRINTSYVDKQNKQQSLSDESDKSFTITDCRG